MLEMRREGTRALRFPRHLWDQPAVVMEASGEADLGVPPRPEPVATPTELTVLASSSGGNCAVLARGEGRRRRLTLIDAGLSPLRTRKMLAQAGFELNQIDDVLFTHLDSDHCHPGWVKALPKHARFRIFRGHRGRAKRARLTKRRTYVFDEAPFEMPDGARITPALLDHDELGVVAFRIDFAGHGGASPGYATDLGRVTPGLLSALAGVDVLAIESNYCPRMQLESDRPEFLKRRIMDGAGHLSNEQCRAAVREIAPRRQVVLLHLSRQCNTPERAAMLHEGAPYALRVASHARPVGPIDLVCARAAQPCSSKTTGRLSGAPAAS